MKKRSDVKKSAFAAMQPELLEDTKLYTADSVEECQQVPSRTHFLLIFCLSLKLAAWLVLYSSSTFEVVIMDFHVHFPFWSV